jgi:adenine deaminase
MHTHLFSDDKAPNSLAPDELAIIVGNGVTTARLMIGTPELFLLYGWTLHREIRNLVEAGLKPYAALAAATRTPAEYLRQLDTIGTIEKGKRADLVLLEANPLDEISNTEKRAGVMTRGRWIPDAEFKKMLDEMAPRFKEAPPKK